MSTLTNRGRYANKPAKLPGLQTSRIDDPNIRQAIDALREWVEVRLGSRGDYFERAVTFRDLVPLLDEVKTAVNTVEPAAGAQSSTELDLIRRRLSILESAMAALVTPQRENEPFVIACSDETTALAATVSQRAFFVPYEFMLVEVQAALVTPQTSGAIFTVDINEAGVSLLSTKLTIDNTEYTSITSATPCVMSDKLLAKGAKITVDIDQVGDGTAKGLLVTLMGYPT